MSIATVRGGVPHIWRQDIPLAGIDHSLPATSNYIKLRVTANSCRIYFSLADYTNNINYIVVDSTNPFDGPVEIDHLWFKAVGGVAPLELTAFQRRG